MSSLTHGPASSSSQSNASEAPTSTIYPPVTHSLSPTWNAWVKLTSYEIHRVLRPVPANFASLSYGPRITEPSPAVFHYINHPIRFISVAGVVVEVNEYNAKYYIFYLDDSSGETIEIVYPRPEGTVHGVEGVVSHAQEETSKIDRTEVELHQLLQGLAVGTVLKVKGHVTTFRSYRQLRIYRVQKIRHTNEEATFWSAMHAFHNTVLSKPWVLTDQQIAKAKADANKLVQERDVESKRRTGREERRHRKLEERWALEETKRAEDAEKARIEGHDLMQMLKRRRDESESGTNANTATVGKRRKMEGS